VTPRFFGITPPMAVFSLAVSSLALAILLFATSHLIAAVVLLVAALLFFVLFAQAARRLPEPAVVRVAAGAFDELRARGGFAVEALAAHGSARMELFRLRREAAELAAARAEAARALGEAVYGHDDEAAERARGRMQEVGALLATKEEEMTTIASRASERIQRAQLEVQPTEVMIEPPAVPEPYPMPSEPPQPVTVPEPSPVPSEPTPPGPSPVPEPSPEPPPEPPIEE
jgi:hypothetical protein